ncbi:MAG: helix-turn-helix domain-containing protein [Oscillospiraceae bacterium]|nr:helix-turn-helix domain-containing protein [Oscillospiraceae bacterium]
MANTVGPLIKAARTKAGMTQEQLAKKVDGVTAADISKAERGEKELSQNALKQIAKATGVTQASLLNAAKEDAAKPASAKKTETAKKTESGKKTETAKKTESGKKTETAKKTESGKKTETAKKTESKKKTATKKEEDLKLTAAEKKLVELYRAASKEDRDNAVKILKGEKLDLLTALGGSGLLDGAMGFLQDLGKK